MNNHWAFNLGGPVVFGRGVTADLGVLVAGHVAARHCLLVSDARLADLGLVARVERALVDAGIAVTVFTGGMAEPPAAVVREAVAVARGAPGVGCVLGLGGGSNLDVAKLAAMVLAHGGDVTDYAGESRVPGPVLPVVCLPTTAGTGSEVSPAAVFTDAEARMKVSCLSNHLRPTLAVVDPALTDSCPKSVTAESGIDALTHAVEALCATPRAEFLARGEAESVYQGANPIARLYALEAIRLVGAHLRAAVESPTDAEARDGMALAATLGGLAFSSAGVALCHAMEYPVGAGVHVSHGAGNGLLLPHVMRFQADDCRAEHAEIARLLGGADAADAVARLAAGIGIPGRLRELGVKRGDLPGYAEKAFTLKRLLRTTRRAVSLPSELLGVYESAY